MYHKAKCKGRVVTRMTPYGEIVHETSATHTHPPMFADASQIPAKVYNIHSHFENMNHINEQKPAQLFKAKVT